MTRTYLGFGVAIAVVFLISTRLVAEQQKTHAALHIQNPDDLKWSPVGSLPYGAEVAALDGDMTKKSEFTVRLRLPPNYKVPPHFHPADEHVTVIDGSFYMGMGDGFDEAAAKEMKTGGFHSISKGTHHYAFTKGAAIIQLHGNGPWGITYVNASDDPRKTATK
jgi:quercetin dioxygenase-like cupin family protein